MAYLASSQVEGLIILNHTSYQPARWHNTVFIIGIAIIATLFNIFLARRLPWIECFVFVVLYVCGYVAFIVAMVIYGYEQFSEPKDVFFGFQDNAGWGSIPEAMLVGQIGAIFSLLGGDAPIHMSEQVKNASLQVPRTIALTVLASSFLGFPMLVVFCFCLGDVETVLATRTGQPYIQILYNTTQSIRCTNSLVICVIIMQIFAVINFQAANSRQTQAFADTNGLPFSKWLNHLPNSVWASLTTTVVFSSINLGSTTAFNLVASLGVSAILLSYLICNVCILVKRYRREKLLARRFNLGSFGVWLNLVVVIYLAVALCFIFFPSAPSSKLEEISWSVFILVGVIVFSVLFYVVKGRKNYMSPAEKVKEAARNPIELGVVKR
jgi:choline transport protein